MPHVTQAGNQQAGEEGRADPHVRPGVLNNNDNNTADNSSSSSSSSTTTTTNNNSSSLIVIEIILVIMMASSPCEASRPASPLSDKAR